MTTLLYHEKIMPTYEELLAGISAKRKYYWLKARDEACEECDGGGRCANADACHAVEERYEEMIAEHECAGCGKLIGPNDDFIPVPGVGICCNKNCARRAV